MTITAKVKSQYFGDDEEHVIRLAPSNPQLTAATSDGSRNAWTVDEHNRFLEALERYPSGPWKTIALFVGSRNTRQTMAHAQKYRERIARQRQAVGVAGAASSGIDTNSFGFFLTMSTTRSDSDQAPPHPTELNAAAVCELVRNFDVEGLNNDADEQLLLSLSETYETAPFSQEEAQWIAEHYESISLL
ncbi:Myb-like dna-binding protein, partial [Globisporangium polare]